MAVPAAPKDVDAVFAAMAPPVEARARELRALVFDVAEAEGLAAPEETLRWGEPAYLPGKSGTAVRITADKSREGCKVLVHCQTSLVETWRDRFGDRLGFEGNRAVLVPASEHIDRHALAICIADALTYRKKKEPARG